MNTVRNYRCGVSLASVGVLLGSIALTCAADEALKLDSEGVAFFERRIRPVLVDHCYKCHAETSESVKGGLMLDTRQAMLDGGDMGPALVPGDVKNSLILKAIRYQDKDLEMPPKQKLPDKVIADFERWVAMGAPDPREPKASPVAKPADPQKSQVDWEVAKNHWAFQPPAKVPAPSVRDAAWPRSDIDKFILAKLEAAGLKPVGDADKRTLIRRVYFDLIGLPPTPEQIDAFLNDHSTDAFAKVVDELLRSPRFGERWGRHWLDVARYAESSGKETNFTYPHAWRYRDYVIDAFNADKPYDRFIMEQIAGDLMDAADESQRAEQITATGFLAIGAKSLNDPNRIQFRMDLIDEQIDTLSQAIMGTTVGCARCHDHKFDPIPQSDYYAMAGIFLSTNTHYGTVELQGNRRPASLLTVNDPAEQPDREAYISRENYRRLQFALDAAKKQEQELRDEFRESVRNRRNNADAQAGNDFVRLRQRLQAISGRVATMEARLAAYDEDGRPKQVVMGVSDADRPLNSSILIRGEIDKRGDSVPRGFVTALSHGETPEIPSNTSGRLQLAEWMTQPQHPTTARVMVNRIWHHLFGRGIVPTVDNFGTTGMAPSHGELLDHLAVSFVEGGWSIKSMIRQIVLSRTYQLASTYDAVAYEKDPDNTLLWRMSKRRLDAEAIRDAMFAVAGQLDLDRPYGSPVMTIGDARATRIPDRMLSSVQTKRSVYLPVIRDDVPESLAVFDFAEPSLVTGDRDTTTVPSQALYMLNSSTVIRLSERAAQQLLMTDADTAVRIDMAYEAALSRPPSADEHRDAMSFFDTFIATLPDHMPEGSKTRAAWTSFCQVLFASGEFRYLN